MSLVNEFMVGCDPEFVAQDPPNLVRATDMTRRGPNAMATSQPEILQFLGVRS